MNKIWMCENDGFSFWKCNDTNNADMSFKIDFNFEPPQYSLIKKPVTRITYTPVRNLSANDKFGNILLYDNVDHYYLNKSDQIIYYKNKLSNFAQSSSSLIFPTKNDSINIVVTILDTLLNKDNYNGEIFFKKHLYNSIQNNFSQVDLPIDFGLPNKYNPLKHHRNNLRTGFACHIFNQIYDEKNDKYFLYFNLGDSIYISEYHKETMIFDAPKTSGLIISGRGDRSVNITINFVVFGWDDMVHSINNDYMLFQNLNTERLKQGNDLSELTLYRFDKTNAQFYSPLFIDSIRNTKGHFTSRIFAPCDSILYYFIWTHDNTPNKLVKVVLNKDMNRILNKYEFTFKDFNLFFDMKLAPNGKIAASVGFRYNPTISNVIRFINNPNDPTSTFNLNKAINYAENLSISCRDNTILFFPNTPGLYKKIDFSYRNNCKKNSVVLTNHSDAFWFKRFTYYMGNGDSVNTTLNQTNIVYHYSKPGKYWVKLKAFTKEGGWVWYSDTIVVQTAPNAYFSNQTTKGCQYIAFGFKDSSSVFQIKKDSAVRHAWHFGDGNSNYWQTYGLNMKQNQSHTYYINGKYTVSHTVSDGYCIDTFSRINEVNILPAPKPGIVATPLTGCVPLNVALSAQYPDNVDSSHWQSTAGHYQSTKNQIGTSFTFNQAGSFKLFHNQYGPTGCVTKDTAIITALQGVNTLRSPELIATTVLDNNQILVNWFKVSYANAYTLYKDNAPLAINITDSFYIDQTKANIKSYTYTLKATDVCNNSTQYSDIGKTILLTANNDKDNFGILRWNPYVNWVNGVKQYNILNIENNGNYILQQTSDSAYKDQDFLIKGKLEKCYRIQAIENTGNNAESQSNTVCVPYESVIWIPSAISINGDGLNESLKISTIGIQSYTISIYNRWGELVYQTSDIGDEWQRTRQQQGVYMYVVKAVTNYGEYSTIGTITVLQ
ncbi:MAG: gliding motility-associated C-terminal domain-containing protein [bacterium]|nr:gliding motility-associated C-terminal domain-containing protein [bacterium]